MAHQSVWFIEGLSSQEKGGRPRPQSVLRRRLEFGGKPEALWVVLGAGQPGGARVQEDVSQTAAHQSSAN